MKSFPTLVCTLSLLLTLPLSVCAAQTPAHAKSESLIVSGLFTPNPPKQGIAELTVTVYNAQHKPVHGARVTISSKMPSMSMDGPTVMAHEVKPGVYKAKENLNAATLWTFEIKAASKTQLGGTKLSAKVH